jgi:tight adherence protein C
MFEGTNIELLTDIARTYLTIRVGEIVLNPIDTSVLALALAAALVSAFNLWRVGQSEDRQDRLVTLRDQAVERIVPAEARGPRWYERLGGLVAASPIVGVAEQRRWLGILASAGIKGQDQLAIFTVSKVCGAVALAAFAWFFLQWRQWFAGVTTIRLALLVGALMLGWRLPEIILSRLAARRRLQIEQGLPDALDLLVISAEAGLSLDQAVDQVSRDIRHSNPAVADEFAATADEMRVLSDRAEALQNLVRRTGLASLRSIAATLSQAIRFGTPLAESMRILAAQMRTERLARMEERAARLPVLLAIPLMAFILPALLVVIGTPVALRISDFLRNFTLGGAP